MAQVQHLAHEEQGLAIVTQRQISPDMRMLNLEFLSKVSNMLFIQRHRINLLRAGFVLLLPLLLLVHPAFGEDAFASELIELVGAFFVIFGVLGRFWAILYIGGHKSMTVMNIGPYSICRHPLYLFSTIAATGLGLLLESIFLAVVVGGSVFLILAMTAKQEEQFLTEKFGDEYRIYAKVTPMIIPDIRLFHTPERVTFSVSHLKGNFFDALVFLLFIPIAELLEGVRAFDFLPVLNWY